jgi:NAD(P)-dependent dehydrogenase (short-subunit alcohol dehydrogenase family)
MSGRLEGKVALVTGAAGGIGGATVARFVQEGARVAAADRDAERLSGTPAAMASTVDVTVAREVEGLLTEVEARFGRLDVLVNVAGASGRRYGDGPVDLCTEEGWDWVMNVNLRSVFLCCKYALPALRRSGGGSVINMGSVLGMTGHERFDTHAYAASKGGVIALSRAMAARYAPEQIRVNVLCPGLIRTPMSARAQADPEILGLLPQLQPLTGDFGEPEDVAEAAVFLAAEESRFITGAVLPVDGGWTAR